MEWDEFESVPEEGAPSTMVLSADLSGDLEADPRASISLCEALDRALHKGVVLRGDIVLSVADVDLVYLGLQVVLCSTETALRAGILRPSPPLSGSPPSRALGHGSGD